jgi:hypothetical protein
MVRDTSPRPSSALTRFGDWMLIATCALVLLVLAFRYSSPVADTAAKEFAPVDAIPASASIGGHARHVFIFAHSACRHCTDSMPFYEALVRGTRSADLAVTFLTIEDIGVFRQYLGAYGIDAPHVQQLEKFSGIPGTPSLVIVDGDKRVVRSLAGRLSGQQEDLVMDLIGLN